MHRKFVLLFWFCAFLAASAALPCLAAPVDELTRQGNEVNANQADYFLYGVIAFAVLVIVVFAVIFFIKRRR